MGMIVGNLEHAKKKCHSDRQVNDPLPIVNNESTRTTTSKGNRDGSFHRDLVSFLRFLVFSFTISDLMGPYKRLLLQCRRFLDQPEEDPGERRLNSHTRHTCDANGRRKNYDRPKFPDFYS